MNNIFGIKRTKNFEGRSYGGWFGNKTFTKKQLSKHKLVKDNRRINIDAKNSEQNYPLYPITIAKHEMNTEYLNPSLYTTIPNNNKTTCYYYPAQNLQDVIYVNKIQPNYVEHFNKGSCYIIYVILCFIFFFIIYYYDQIR